MKTQMEIRWSPKRVAMLTDETFTHTEGHLPDERAKWTSIPYILPDGRRGVWWQPWKPLRYKAIDLTYSRARERLYRVHRSNVKDSQP